MHVEKEILVIDDNEQMLSILKTYLEHDGFKVQTCPSAVSAIALAKEHRFDVYIVDYRLPGMKGDAITAAIRGMQPSAIIIGYSVEPKEQAFLSAGADKFIVKEKISAEISAFIRQRLAHVGCKCGHQADTCNSPTR